MVQKNKLQVLEKLIASVFYIYIYQHIRELFYNGAD